MMKRLVCFLLTLLLLTATASADILWEPYEDDYYQAHMEEMEGVDRIYAVPEGMTVNVYRSPETGGLVETLQAGERVYVGFSAEINGETWGVGYDGWFRLGRLQREYNSDDFLADYAGDLSDGGSTEAADGLSVYAWTWPGSGVLDREVVLNADYDEGHLSYSRVYTDPEGGRWGYVGYYMGPCGWIWLDDPTNPAPPLRLNPQMENTVTDTSPTEQEPGAARQTALIRIAVLAAAVVLLTAVGIAGIKRKKRNV